TLAPAACAYTSTCNASGATSGCEPMGLPDGTSMMDNYEGGNIDLRVPYIGYSSESESYTAAGISAYNALQTHLEKRISHGLQVGFSYTYSHATDEQSAMGLFYNGNNATDLRSGYGLSDFDRTHVINFTYLYELPKFYELTSWRGRFADGWAVSGLAIIQSGQPYSVIDYSGAVGSLYYGTSDGITNPVVPLAPGCTPSSAYTPSFDIPINNVTQNLNFNDFPVYGSQLYSSPTLSGIGIVNKTIGSPRQIQMSLKFTF